MRAKIHCDLCSEGPFKWAMPFMLSLQRNKYFGIDKNVWRQILHLMLEPLAMTQITEKLKPSGHPIGTLPILVGREMFKDYVYFICHRCFLLQKCSICGVVGMMRKFRVQCRRVGKLITFADECWWDSKNDDLCTNPRHVIRVCKLDQPWKSCDACKVYVCHDCSRYEHRCNVDVRPFPNVRSFTRAF